MLQTLVNGLIAGSLLAVPAIGFSAMFSVLAYPNFAIGALASVGAYAGWLVNSQWGWPLPAAFAAAFVIAGLIAALAERIAIRPLRNAGALMMAIASLAIGLILENLLRFGFGNDLRNFDLPIARDLRIGELRIGPQQIDNVAIALVTMILLWLFLRHTWLGRSMRAVADNPDLARLKGVDPERVALIAVLIGGGLCGIGGTLIGLDTSIEPLTGPRLVLSVFAAAVLGGLGSIPGAVLGAVLIGIVEELTVLELAPTYRTASGFLIILVVLTFRPSGLLGLRRA